MYDFAHGLSDSTERITHSICTLEFEDHRPLYDWLLDALEVYHPRQIEFARLNLSYTILSKRKLIDLVAGGMLQDGPTRDADDIRLRRRMHSKRSAAATASALQKGQYRRYGALTASGDLNKSSPRDGGTETIAVVIENYPRSGGRTRCREQSGRPGDGHEKRAFLAVAVHRAGRFSRRPAQAVLPPVTGP
jgi:glutaminyl-tRNA synthetase